jgi:hypothetical protein
MVYTDLYYFGTLSYYTNLAQAESVLFDTNTPFSKMSFKNRMVIASAQGPLHLTIPIAGGRDQKTPMNEVRISYDSPWQTQHYKSICTNYKRAPYFEYYVDSLHTLYHTEFDLLNDFLLTTQRWIQQQLKAKWVIEAGLDIQPINKEHKWMDPFKPNNFQTASHTVKYQQVFENTTGFIPNTCIIDLLFAMGGKQANSMLTLK